MSTPEQQPEQKYPWLRFAAALTAAVLLAQWGLGGN
jgi:hypothetical protein